jgi:hypothetical protein
MAMNNEKQNWANESTLTADRTSGTASSDTQVRAMHNAQASSMRLSELHNDDEGML